MINKIFLDADETLLHTVFYDPNQEHIRFHLEGKSYYTIIRPCTQRLIDLCRELVGKDNVYILTAAMKDYITTINEKAGWDFDAEHLIPREEIERHCYPAAYGGTAYIEKEGIAHKDNVLIDNLPYRQNMGKVNLIGILEDRYLHVRDYYGVNGRDNDTFENDVMNFLKEKMV